MKRRNVLTCAGGGGSPEQVISRGFTMAEILLSLTIIGVVAAITLPSLTGNINERTWNTQRKALYARFSQAMSLMSSLNGYGILTETTDDAGSTSIEDTAAETFVTNGLSKVLKINNICDNEHLSDCGVPSKVIAANGSVAFTEFPKTMEDFNPEFNNASIYLVYGFRYNSQINTKTAAFETANGESIAVFYNPRCQNIYEHFMQVQMCANFVYDLNGSKGPNTLGKDIGFITAFKSTDPVVVAPMPLNHPNMGYGMRYPQLAENCRKYDADSRVPNVDELKSLIFNKKLWNFQNLGYWSSTFKDATNVYTMGTNGSIGSHTTTANQNALRCIKR